MFKEKRILFLIAETPVHAGSGEESGFVDLPIQRERYTEFPKIESSGLKGCIREAFENSNKQIKINSQNNNVNNININDKNAIGIVFGPEEEEAHAGAMTTTDTRILLFPVKSLKGVFAWITCPFVLERFKKDLEIAGVKINDIVNTDFNNLQNTLPTQTNLLVSGKVVLEEFTFEVKENDKTAKLAQTLSKVIFSNKPEYTFWSEKLKRDLIILPNDDFKQFVKSSTEVITRTKINNTTGTVQTGGLWTEEYLPQDTIMYSILMFSSPRVKDNSQKGVFKGNDADEEAKKVVEFFEKGLPEVIQIGGNQSIGKGFVRVKIYPEPIKNKEVNNDQ